MTKFHRRKIATVKQNGKIFQDSYQYIYIVRNWDHLESKAIEKFSLKLTKLAWIKTVKWKQEKCNFSAGESCPRQNLKSNLHETYNSVGW